jgi:hypothetical protein
MDEARTTSTAPFRVEGRVIAIALAVASALVLDGLGGFAVQLLTVPR